LADMPERRGMVLMVRLIGFMLWIGGALVMIPLWMKLDPLALAAFAISLIGGSIVGWTEDSGGGCE